MPARGRDGRGPGGGKRVEGASQRPGATPRVHDNHARAAATGSPAPGPASGQLTPSTRATLASPAIPGSAPSVPAGRGGAWGRFLTGFVYAGRGLGYALHTQRNMRVHAALAVAAIALGIVLRLSPVEWALIFVAITSVFISEMFNTVVEACVDLVTREFHPLARVAKDVAAGAVLLNAILSVVVALFVYVPHLWPLLVRWLGK